MKFQSRIKHVEQKLNIGASEFCACAGDPRYTRAETVYWENGKPATYLALTDQTLPDVCEHCEKPIHKMTVIINFVESTIPKPVEAR